jgi:hypothetical protein
MRQMSALARRLPTALVLACQVLARNSSIRAMQCTGSSIHGSCPPRTCSNRLRGIWLRPYQLAADVRQVSCAVDREAVDAR